MEFRSRKIGVITEIISIPQGSTNPCALRLVRYVDGNLIEDEKPRPYPSRSDLCRLIDGDVVSLNEDGTIDDVLSILEQEASIETIRAFKKEALNKYKISYGIGNKSDEEKYKMVTESLLKIISKVETITAPPPPPLKRIK